MITDYIKDPLKVKLRDYEILARVKTVNQSIITLDQDDRVSENEYLEVVRVMSGNSVVREGDIIIRVSAVQAVFKVNGEEYAIIRDNAVVLAVDRENFKIS